MAAVVLLSDRSPSEVLPALAELALDLKLLPLSLAEVPLALAVGPEAVMVDAAESPGQGLAVLRKLREAGATPPAIALLERRDLERLPWDQSADEILFPSTSAAEVRLRLSMLRRRWGIGEGSTIRLGPMILDTDGYRVVVSGRALDLTYKEFELLRHLASHPGRVFTRPTLLREVWGYDFYGGTRTVDVHVRRLRAKLGPEHEHLIGTVRGVGYRAADL
ncbi:MAG TPA: response regulator transcription factor [Actinomycetota bacterium]|nr:response regulator transcription factor [Actinomycetota bacterium]